MGRGGDRGWSEEESNRGGWAGGGLREYKSERIMCGMKDKDIGRRSGVEGDRAR